VQHFKQYFFHSAPHKLRTSAAASPRPSKKILKLIRFGKTQNLASTKTFDLLPLASAAGSRGAMNPLDFQTWYNY